MDLAIGDNVKQNRCRHPNDAKFVGRVSTISDMFIDENGTCHVKTTDGTWCPGDLLDKVEPVTLATMANDYVLAQLKDMAAELDIISMKIDVFQVRINNLIDEIEL